MKKLLTSMAAVAITATTLAVSPSAQAERPVSTTPAKRIVVLDEAGDVTGDDHRVDLSRVTYRVAFVDAGTTGADTRPSRALVIKAHYKKPARNQQVRTWVEVDGSTFVVLYKDSEVSVARTTPTPAKFPQVDWYRAAYHRHGGYLQLVLPVTTFANDYAMLPYAFDSLTTSVSSGDGSADRVGPTGPLAVRRLF
jgi:hypothetical protein